jgi:mono/diheme cytochrome c family protein
MKKILVIAGIMAIGFTLSSCNKVRRNPGRAYMPDMNYSRAYETYATSVEELKKKGINYTGLPVAGTVSRDDYFDYTLKNDSAGYAQSSSVLNPLNKDSIDMKESERLYLVNCAICHGTKLDGMGPLFNSGKGPFPNAPKNLMADDMKRSGIEGTMFHVITYGKGAMGSYAAQLSTPQRWMVVTYIRSKQGAMATATMSGDSTKAGDSTKTNRP